MLRLTIFDVDASVGVRHPCLGRRCQEDQNGAGYRHFGLDPPPFYARHLPLPTAKNKNWLIKALNVINIHDRRGIQGLKIVFGKSLITW